MILGCDTMGGGNLDTQPPLSSLDEDVMSSAVCREERDSSSRAVRDFLNKRAGQGGGVVA
jgi:hypothetical protein